MGDHHFKSISLFFVWNDTSFKTRENKYQTDIWDGWKILQQQVQGERTDHLRKRGRTSLRERKREIGRTFKKWSFEWFTLEQPPSLDDACSLLNSLVRSLSLSLYPFFFFSLIRSFSLSSTKLHTYLSVREPTDLQLPFIFVSCLASFPTLLPSLIHAIMKSTPHKKRQRRERRDEKRKRYNCIWSNVTNNSKIEQLSAERRNHHSMRETIPVTWWEIVRRK